MLIFLLMNKLMARTKWLSFSDNVLICIRLNKKCFILIQISPVCFIDYKSALVQVMSWHPVGGKTLPETMMTIICDMFSSLGHNEFKEVQFYSIMLMLYCNGHCLLHQVRYDLMPLYGESYSKLHIHIQRSAKIFLSYSVQPTQPND